MIDEETSDSRRPGSPKNDPNTTDVGESRFGLNPIVKSNAPTEGAIPGV